MASEIIHDDEIRKFLLDTMQEGKEFIITQAPDTIQQWLHWQYSIFMIDTIVFAILLIIAIGVGIWSTKKYISTNKDCYAPPLVTSYLCSVVFLLIVWINFYNLLYISIAPKAYVLDYLLQ